MASKNDESEFVQSFIKEIQVQSDEQNQKQQKTRGKHTIIIVAVLAIIAIIVASVIIFTFKSAQKIDNNQSDSAIADNDSSMADVDETKDADDDSGGEAVIIEEEQIGYEYWEVNDLIDAAGSYDAEERAIEDYFNKKLTTINVNDADQYTVLMTEKALAYNYHQNTNRAKDIMRSATAKIGATSHDVKQYACANIKFIAYEAKDNAFFDSYKPICGEMKDE